ncbi:SDR family oxidoreductase [Sodalis sp. RH24]|uniref:SDR family oxidoreductase n=1 Tax=unclassified Sodalis (in: enterobacteria) TaxID=2636512 RepID=UPI0039B65BFE
MAKTLLITGTSSGIGLAAAGYFADQGWNVVATLRHPQPESPLAGRDNILLTRLDVEDAHSIGDAIDAGMQRFGAIDTLVNNAGFGQFGLFEAVTEAQIQRQFAVNVFGVMAVTRALLPHFRRQGSGTVINLSSGAGLFTLPMISLYCASKFALEGFSEALAYELAAVGIGVKLVIPHGGVTETRFVERQGEYQAQDKGLTDYALFIAKTQRAFAALGAARTISALDVAKVIHEAATDGSDRLRYLIGDDSRGFIRARRELPEDEYIAFMRERFC